MRRIELENKNIYWRDEKTITGCWKLINNNFNLFYAKLIDRIPWVVISLSKIEQYNYFYHYLLFLIIYI